MYRFSHNLQAAMLRPALLQAGSSLRGVAHLAYVACVMCMMCAVVLLQTLGLVHSIQHNPFHSPVNFDLKAPRTVAVAVPAKLTERLNTQADTRSLLTALFASHASGTDCRLYDAASCAGALVASPLLAWPVLMPSTVVAFFEGQALARWAALFNARGPPLNR